jgi:hypothetical protein
VVTEDRLKRAESAVNELAAGQMDIQPNGDGTFEVKDYTVDLDGPSCTCADHEYNEVFCKHIVAVELQSMWGNITVAIDTESDVPPQPKVLDPQLSNIPERLRGLEQWVCWKQKLHENKDGSKRWTKVPVDAVNGGFASSTDEETWTDFRTAVGTFNTESEIAGVGVSIHDEGNVIGIDIDDCRDPEDGAIDEPVRALLSDVDTYVEVSPSGTGLRIFVLGETDLSKGTVAELPGEAHVEMYDTGRYLTVTGHRLDRYGSEDVREDEVTINQFEALMSDGTTLEDY